jgi:hypothetical protein
MPARRAGMCTIFNFLILDAINEILCLKKGVLSHGSAPLFLCDEPKPVFSFN